MIKKIVLLAMLFMFSIMPVCADWPPKLYTPYPVGDGIYPTSGDYADYDIEIKLPEEVGADGYRWYVSAAYHVPCGNNGGSYPGDHTTYVSTYDTTLWPNDGVNDVLNVPRPGVKVMFWCGGGETWPDPDNKNVVIRETWPGGTTGHDTEFGTDFPLWSGNVCSVAVWDSDYPKSSAVVSNIHTSHPDECDDVRVGHHSFRLFFSRIDFDEPVPTATVTNSPIPQQPTATPIVIDVAGEIREAAWNSVGVNYNPDAAFSIYARANELGIPMANEFDYKGYRAQPFAGGIVYARIGEWDKVKHLEW